MKNILYVGPYHQNDGWGYAAREYLRALKHTGHNLHARPIYLNSQTKYNHFDEFNDIEQNRIHQFDVIIQHGLPNLFRYYGGVLNIGISFFETYDIKSTPWPSFLNMMDKVWVSSTYEKQSLERSGIEPPITVIKIPTDLSKYEKDYSFPELSHHDHEFKFYFIGEYGTRKNVNSLLLAYYREFHNSEQTCLVLKLNKVGVDASALLAQIRLDIESFNTTHRIYQRQEDYKEVVIIPTYLKEEELYGLHKSCQCFVMPSYGEAFCLPAFDAKMFKNDILVNKNTGMADYSETDDYCIESHLVPAVALDRPLNYLYTGKDMWYNVDVLDLQKKMRMSFDNRNNEVKNLLKHKYVDQIKDQYSYEAVAKTINDSLDEI